MTDLVVQLELIWSRLGDHNMHTIRQVGDQIEPPSDDDDDHNGAVVKCGHCV
jgi:hypothetical protein